MKHYRVEDKGKAQAKGDDLKTDKKRSNWYRDRALRARMITTFQYMESMASTPHHVSTTQGSLPKNPSRSLSTDYQTLQNIDPSVQHLVSLQKASYFMKHG